MYIKVIEEVRTLEDAEKAIDSLQRASEELFMFAWQKGWHKELAAYTMKLKDGANKDEGAGN